MTTPPNSDPFRNNPGHNSCKGPNCLTDDTIANANIVLSDVGGTAARLVNVCSYPSNPGSDPSDCVVTPGAGFLSIVKVASPNDGTPFVFNASKASTDGAAQWTINGSGSQLLIPYTQGTLNLNEVVPAGWQLGSASCRLNNAPGGTLTGTPTATGVNGLSIQSGLETVCTFTDTQAPGTLTLMKVVDNLGQSGPGYKTPADFPLTIDGNPTTSGTPVQVAAGTRTIAETSLPGYTVGTWTCSNGTTGSAGSVSATVSVGPAQNVTCTMTNTLVAAPALKVVKSVTSVGPYQKVGDVIAYAIMVTNTGNVNLTGVTVTDPGAGVVLGTCTPSIPATIAPGASVACAASHAVTQADIDAGTYTNTAVADSNETLPSNASQTVPITQNPALKVLKTVTSAGPFSKVGDVISYSITATNTGNQTLTGVTVTDAGVGAVLGTCTPVIPATLAPHAVVACTATHTVTQADIDAGKYTNVATGDSNQTPPASDDETVAISQAAHLTLVKSATETNFSTVGQVIHYTLVATNSGNVTLSGVSISDPKLGTLSCTQPATLAPGGKLSCTGSYTVTQADLDAGVVHNVATATGTPPSGPNVSVTDDESVPSSAAAHITLKKTATEPSVHRAGDVIHYTLVATNDGDVTLSNVTIVDSKLGALSCAQPATLAPGDSLTCTGSHAATQPEIDAGSVDNLATVTAKPPSGSNVSDTDSASVPAIPAPALNVTKTVTSVGPYAAVGDVIAYGITVENTGNITLTGVTVTDPGTGVVLGSCTPSIPASLAPGASVICGATHAVTQADIDAGSYTNIATGDSSQTPPDTDTATVAITQNPALKVDQDRHLDRPVRQGRRDQLLDHRHQHRQPDPHWRHDHRPRSRRRAGDVHAGDPDDARTRRHDRLRGEPHGDAGRHRRRRVRQHSDRRFRPDRPGRRQRERFHHAASRSRRRQDGHLDRPVRRGQRRDHV